LAVGHWQGSLEAGCWLLAFSHWQGSLEVYMFSRLGEGLLGVGHWQEFLLTVYCLLLTPKVFSLSQSAAHVAMNSSRRDKLFARNDYF
jgi:hypothetical protein